MNKAARIPSSQRLADANAEAMEHHGKMRAAVMSTGMISAELKEIVLTAQFAVLGYEHPFKIHARRAVDLGVTRESLRAILMTGLGATSVASQVASTLSWLDEALSQSPAD